MISFIDFLNMGRPHWRGQTSLPKALYFLVLGSPDMHTRMRNSYVLKEIEELQLPEESSVLEGGCGRAITLLWLSEHHPGWSLTGIELDPVMTGSIKRILATRKWPGVRLVEADILQLDEVEAYDLIIFIDTLEHIHDDLGLLKRFRRALKPRGKLIIHVPRRHQEMWRVLPIFRSHGVVGHVRSVDGEDGPGKIIIEGHVRDEYTADELRDVVERAGLRVVNLRETVGRLGEMAFELNNMFWKRPMLRYLFGTLTYPLAITLAYLDVRRNPQRGNSLLLTAEK